MPGLDPSFSVKKPVSVWNQPLQADYKGLFSALAKTAFHGATGQFTEAGADVLDGLSALGIEKDAPQLAWLLIRRALLQAMADLLQESQPVGSEPRKKDLQALSERLDRALESSEVTIDRSFFEKPASLSLLKDLQGPFSDWLQGYGLPKPAADSTAGRLPSYFVLALHAEWRRNSGAYALIQQEVATPFTQAAERERAWSHYAAKLQKQVDEPMFGEAFGLRQIYVPLRAFYVEDVNPREQHSALERVGREERKERRIAVNLEEEIDSWLARGPKADGYRIISGGPGSGKSSFGKMYAAKMAAEGKVRTLFISLHQFNVSGSLVEAVGEFVRLGDELPANPLDPETGEDFLFILFDGLDELSQQGRVAAEVARDFLREVQKVVEIRNQSRRRLAVLVTGREPVVQANTSELRDRRRILHVLPYFVPNQKWHSGEELVKEDQRHIWWERYAEATGGSYSGLPKELARTDLDEITSQPLLNYLVALSYGRGQLDFTGDLNLNDIYRDLLEAVYSRTWEERQHLAIRGMSLQEFVRVLEEIALSAWHGNGRTTTVSEIESHCQAAGLDGLLERFEDGAKAGVARVLTAFYFRQYGQNLSGERTFEFTHKSFREYLTALRIVRAMERIETELARRRESFDAGWDERVALKHWTEICGANPLDLELWKYVRNEIKARRKDKVKAWQEIFCDLISKMLRVGMPMELLSPRPSYLEESQRARNAEEALLAVLSACSSSTKVVSKINWPRDHDSKGASAGDWITRLRGQRTSGDNRMILRSLFLLDISRCIFHMTDFYAADLSGSLLRNSEFFYSIFIHANLKETDLRGAILNYANLKNARLEGANLERADLERADLVRASLRGANLEGANLLGANLVEANLVGANLVGANLEEANLVEANLVGANLEGAILEGARLEGARLIGPQDLARVKGQWSGTPKFRQQKNDKQ